MHWGCDPCVTIIRNTTTMFRQSTDRLLRQSRALGWMCGMSPLISQDRASGENTVTPRDTLLLCLPAALVLLACVCGLAVLGPRAAGPTAPPTDGRRHRSWRPRGTGRAEIPLPNQ